MKNFFTKHYRWIALVLIVVLTIVYIKRKQIAELPITKKKMEFFKALYDQDLDSAKHVIDEVIDSSFYMK